MSGSLLEHRLSLRERLRLLHNSSAVITRSLNLWTIQETSLSSMKLKHISLDDWCGWYLDGKLIQQGHSTNEFDLLKKLGFEIEEKYIGEDDLDEFGNSLPEELEKIEEYIVRNNL